MDIGHGINTDLDGEIAVAKGLGTVVRHGGKNGGPNWGCLVAIGVAVLAIVVYWLY